MNNRKAINDFRIAHGLLPIEESREAIAQRKARARAAAANKAAHAALQREIRNIRNRKGK